MSPVSNNQPPSSTRIRLQDMTCPLIRVEDARQREKRDKRTGFMVSLALHAVIITIVGVSLMHQPQFAVDQGESGIEVSLIAAPTETVPQDIPPPVEEEPDFVDKVEPLPPVPPKEIRPPEPTPTKTNGKDEITAQSAGGAISEAKPDYLKNPAPEYPESARRRGTQGTVLLSVKVSREGIPLQVNVEKTSGSKTLDEAALKAVKKWQFSPAKLGSLPIESTVRVPVKFDLKNPS